MFALSKKGNITHSFFSNKDDVINGRGKKSFGHLGNRRYVRAFGMDRSFIIGTSHRLKSTAYTRF